MCKVPTNVSIALLLLFCPAALRADVPTQEQSQEYVAVMQAVVDAAQHEDTNAVVALCDPVMAKFLQGGGMQPVFKQLQQIGEVKEMDCPYIYEGTATVTMVGTSANAYYNLCLTTDGKIEGWGRHIYRDGEAFIVSMPPSAYKEAIKVLVTSLNTGDPDSFEQTISPTWAPTWPAEWKQHFLDGAAKMGAITDNVIPQQFGADSMTFTLVGAKAARDVTITLDANGLVCTCGLHDSVATDPSNFDKPPDQVTAAAVQLVEAINQTDVSELEALFAAGLAQQLPPDKALTYITRVHEIAGALAGPQYANHGGDAYTYKLFGANGDLTLRVSVDAANHLTWFELSLVVDDSPAVKAGVRLPKLELERPGETN